MDAKKISFGFSKVTKKLNLQNIKQSAKDESKVELIKCLEGQEIKLVQEKPEEAPLTIPLRENHKTSAAIASLIKRRAVLLGEDEPQIEEQSSIENQPVTNGDAENLEKRAERELLAELKANGEETEEASLVLPIVKPDELPLEGAKESTMDDYDSIPVQKFGTAMLRGMGWVEPPKKKGAAALVDEAPMVRPKGMGLGADKALKAKPLLVAPEPNEVLEIKKQAYVRILGGKHKDLYGQIEGFDDHAGRVIVKMAIGGMKEAFNEFLCQPISKKEFAQYGKCINSAKYEEFKKLENEHGQIIIKREVKDEQPRIKKESPDDRWRHDKADSHNNFKKEETARRPKSSSSLSEERRRGDESGSRKYPDERSKSTRRHDDLDRNYQSNSKYRDESKEKRRSRSREAKPQTSSHGRRTQQSPSSDSGESSESESDSDSALERKHKKKSSKKSKSRRKSKKSKSKSRHRHHTPPLSEGSDDCSSDDNEERRRSSKNHKKKTKRSKKPRSRSRSRGRR